MVTRQVLYWFRARSEAAARAIRARAFPRLHLAIPRHQSIYGFPATGGIEEGVKLATEQYDVATTPESVSRTVDPTKPRDVRDLRRAVLSRPVAGLRPAQGLHVHLGRRARFIIDRHPALDRVIIASPCSGHGFKHSAGIGELLAEMVTDGKKPDPRFAFS